MLKYTKMPVDAFEKLQINAGILVDGFDPASGTIGNILGATSGGINFATNPTYVDYGEDVDNCPPNTKQLKRVSYYDPQLSGTFLTCTPAVIASLIGAADVDISDATHVIPRAQLLDTDFKKIWFIGDYSDVNTGADAGFLAICVKNALNTTGFQIQTTKDAKGTMAIEYHGHYDLEDSEQTPPFDIYCKEGENNATPSVHLSTHYVEIKNGASVTLGVTVQNSSEEAELTSGNTTYVTVDGYEITGAAVGNTVVTASITDDGITYVDTCTVKVVAAT